MVQEFEQRRNYVVERIERHGGLSCFRPMGAVLRLSQRQCTYVQRKCLRSDHRFRQLAEHLLQTAGRRRGASAVFGDDRCVRLSFATSMEQLHTGLDRMEQFAKGLQA